MAVGGEENREPAGGEPERRAVGRVGEEGDVLLRCVRLGDVRQCCQGRPENGFAAGLDELDIEVLLVRFKFAVGDGARGVGLDEGKTAVAIEFKSAERLVSGKCFEKAEREIEPGREMLVARPLRQGIENHAGHGSKQVRKTEAGIRVAAVRVCTLRLRGKETGGQRWPVWKLPLKD